MARHYMARIDNLRMATKYSFHVRPQFRRRNLKIMGRSEIFHNGLEEDEADIRGHTIIIPTKGCKFVSSLLPGLHLVSYLAVSLSFCPI